MTTQLTPDISYSICETLEKRSIRHKRYTFDGPQQAYAGYRGILWVTARRAVFQRDFNGRDIVIPWDKLESVTVHKVHALKLLSLKGNETEITVPISRDETLLFFLNALADRCREYHVDTTKLDEIREYLYDIGGMNLGGVSWFELLFALLVAAVSFAMLLGALFVPMVLIKEFMAGLNTLNPPPANPYAYIFVRAVPAVLLGTVFFAIWLWAMLRTMRWHVEWADKRKRTKFERYKAILDDDASGEYWKAYRERKREEDAKLLEENDEARRKNFEDVSRMISACKNTPRTVRFSARWASFGREMGLVVILIYPIFLGGLLVFGSIGSRIDGTIRDFFPSRWHDAGEAVVESVRVWEVGAKNGRESRCRVTLKKTGSDGVERIVAEPREIRCRIFTKGDKVSVQNYQPEEKILRIADSELDRRWSEIPIAIAVAGGFFLLLFLLVFFGSRISWNVFRDGEAVVGRIINPGRRQHVAIKRGKRWERRIVRRNVQPSGVGNGVALGVLCPGNATIWCYSATPLPYGIEFEPESRSFLAPGVGFFLPVTTVMAILVAEFLVVAACLLSV